MSDVSKNIIRNTFWLALAKGFNSVISYILIVAIAKFLGDVGLGQYSFVFAFVGLIFLLGDLGLNYLMIKDVSRDKKTAQRYFENILAIKIVSGLLLIGISFLITLFIDKDPMVIRSLWVVIISQFFGLFSLFFSDFFKSHDQMSFEAISSIIERIAALGLGLYFLFTSQSLLLFVVALLIAQLLRLGYLIIFIRKKVKFRLSFDMKIWKEMFLLGLPFFLTGAFIFIYFRIDTVMLSFMQGDQVTGWYNSAYKLINILSLIPMILITATLPSMSRLFKENKPTLIKLFHRSFKYLFMIALPITIGTIVLSERFIFFIYGKSFLGGSLSLQILVLAELFLFVNYIMGHLLNSIDKQKYFMYIAGYCALFNIVLNAFLIPIYSYVGAGVATVLTELINFLLLRKYVGLYLTKVKITTPIFKSFIAAILMGIVIYYLRFLPVWWVVPIAVIIYAVLLLIFKLDKDDKDLAKGLFDSFMRIFKRVFKISN